jgi:hypothetical protein
MAGYEQRFELFEAFRFVERGVYCHLTDSINTKIYKPFNGRTVHIGLSFVHWTECQSSAFTSHSRSSARKLYFPLVHLSFWFLLVHQEKLRNPFRARAKFVL